MRQGRKRPSAPPAPAGPEALAVRPVRTASWSEKEPEPDSAGDPFGARVVVERPLPVVRSLSGLLQRISALTGVRRLRLDGPGSFVWRRMDGSRSVAELADELGSRLGPGPGHPVPGAAAESSGGPPREAPHEAALEAESRVVRFVILLRREELVGLPGLDDARIEEWRARSGGAPEGAAGNRGA